MSKNSSIRTNSVFQSPTQNGDRSFIPDGSISNSKLQDSSITRNKLAQSIRMPIGSILAWNAGYYTNGSNAGYTYVLGSSNSIAGANSYLNSFGFYVCDGSTLNDTESPIWNTTGRYLPNLTDSRFLMGSTTIGSIGGQNSITITSANLPTHTHDMAHTHGSFMSGTESATHTHNPMSAYNSAIGSGGTNVVAMVNGTTFSTNFSNVSSFITMPTESATHTHTTNISAYAGSTGNGGFANTAIENRPLYLSILYIIKVK